MADLISREEVLKNYQSICEGVACTDCQMRYDDGECKLERFLRDAPTIEAEPIVRCGECKYYLNSNEKCGLIDTRLRFYETNKTWTEDAFCSWGERTDEAEE